MMFVFDACSIIAFIRDEKGSQIVQDLFNDAFLKTSSFFIHKVTIAEIYYDVLRSSNSEIADQLLRELYSLPVIIIDSLDDDFIRGVAKYKVLHKVSFADCFVLALAEMKGAAVVSADHHEFDVIEKAGHLKFHWIR